MKKGIEDGEDNSWYKENIENKKSKKQRKIKR